MRVRPMTPQELQIIDDTIKEVMMEVNPKRLAMIHKEYPQQEFLEELDRRLVALGLRVSLK